MFTFDANFLARCRSLHEAARRSWGRRFLARRIQLRAAGGTEVTGYTDYTAGDDPRYIDWHRCMRLDELVTAQFQGNEDQYVYILLDASPSMGIGDPSKFEFARQLAGALGYLALENQDRVGISTFSTDVAAKFPPTRYIAHAPRMLKFLEQQQVSTQPTHLAKAVDNFMNRTKASGMVIVVSDLLDAEGFTTAFDLLRRRGFEPYIVHTYAPEETRPQFVGRMRLDDAESGRPLRVAFDEKDVANYMDEFNGFCNDVRSYCAQHGFGFTQTACDVDVLACIHRMMRVAGAQLQTR